MGNGYQAHFGNTPVLLVIEITAPTANTIWQAGTTNTVRWTATNWPVFGRRYREAWQGGRFVQHFGRVSSSEGSNSTALRLPATEPGGGYQIRLFRVENPQVGAESGLFTVVAPSTVIQRWELYH